MKEELEFERIEAPTRRGQNDPVPPRRITLPGMFGKPLSLAGVKPEAPRGVLLRGASLGERRKR